MLNGLGLCSGILGADLANGSGTTGLVACSLGRHYMGIDINEKYIELTRTRLSKVQSELFQGGLHQELVT